ncbi:MAG: Smr/MutS family protein [Vicinamibacterales bacterium]
MTATRQGDDNVAVGDSVQTPLGRGVVRELRNNGRLLVEVRGRSIIVNAPAWQRLDVAARRVAPGTHRTPDRARGRPDRRIIQALDLHGCSVAEAMARVDETLDRALRQDVGELQVIHGRSGGRLRSALHQRLAHISAVRRFRLDPRNPGVTIVTL